MFLSFTRKKNVTLVEGGREMGRRRKTNVLENIDKFIRLMRLNEIFYFIIDLLSTSDEQKNFRYVAFHDEFLAEIVTIMIIIIIGGWVT